VRIFTPFAELPFAGHPSVGAAHTLVRTGRLPAGTVRQECGAGVLDLVVDDAGALSTGVWLVAVGLLPPDGTAEYVITQGVKLGRPSVLSGSVTAAGSRAVSASVHGAVVPVASGRIRVP
jgi:trans-2,3-dihydro-3-hydroxyanthranilate isomerase